MRFALRPSQCCCKCSYWEKTDDQSGRIKAAEILDDLRQSGTLALRSNWRRDHLLLAAVRLLARRGLVAYQQGRLVLLESVTISAEPSGTSNTSFTFGTICSKS